MFTVVGANLHRLDTGRHLFQVQPYTILRSQGIRIGVLGLSAGVGNRKVEDALESAKYYVPLARKSADIVIVLSHQPFEADSILAVSVEGIDLIVGGFPREKASIPLQIGSTFVRHGSPGYGSLMRLDLKVDDKHIQEVTSTSIPLDVASSQGVESTLQGWTTDLDGGPISLLDVLGTSAGGFGKSSSDGAALGFLIADLVRTSTDSDLALIGTRGIHPELDEGPISVLDLFQLYGLPDKAVIVALSGSQIKKLLEDGLEDLDSFVYPSGIKVTYNLSSPQGERVSSIALKGEPLNLEKSYRVAVEEGNRLFEEEERKGEGDGIRDLLARHIKSAGVIRGLVDDRMKGSQ